MIKINKKVNGLQIELNIHFCTISFNKTKNDRPNKTYKAICQYNKYIDGFVTFFLSVGKYSLLLDDLKVKKGKYSHKTLFRII